MVFPGEGACARANDEGRIDFEVGVSRMCSSDFLVHNNTKADTIPKQSVLRTSTKTVVAV